MNIVDINEVDRKTRNLVWNGYCRFGIGFGSWKHALMAGVTGGNNAGVSLSDQTWARGASDQT